MYINIAEFKISDWRARVNTNLVLRVFPNESFVAEDGLDGDLIEANGDIFGQVPVVVADETVNGYTSPTLTIPAVTIHSTTDARINPLATYRAEIWSTRLRKKVADLPSLTSFRVPFTGLTTTWSAIIQFNSPLVLGATRSLDEEIKMLINTTISGLVSSLITGTTGRIPKFNTLGDGITDSSFAEIPSGFAPIADDTKNLGASTMRWSNGYIKNVVSESATIDDITITDTFAGNTGVFTGNFNVGGNLGVTGNIGGAIITGLSGSVSGTWNALDSNIGNFIVVNSAREGSETGVFTSRLLMWDGSSLANPFVRLDRNGVGSVPLVKIFDNRASIDALDVQRDRATEDSQYIIKGSNVSHGEAGIDSIAQFSRLRESVRGIPSQTIKREVLNTTTIGGAMEDIIALFIIPNDHPSDHEGEKYSFRVLGDVTGTTSTHKLTLDIGGDQPVTYTIGSGLNVTWEVKGSISLLNFTPGDYVVEGEIIISDGTVRRGAVFGSTITALDGIALEVLAEDSGTGETRARFIEVFHEDWKV